MPDNLFCEVANGLEQANIESPPLSQVELLDAVRLPIATSIDAALKAANAEGNNRERCINEHPC